jgi:hypothetical protein
MLVLGIPDEREILSLGMEPTQDSRIERQRYRLPGSSFEHPEPTMPEACAWTFQVFEPIMPPFLKLILSRVRFPYH